MEELEALKKQAQDIREAQEKLSRKIAELEEKESKKEWPQDGDVCWIINIYAEVASFRFSGREEDIAQLSINNIFKSEAEGIKERDRRIAETKVLKRLHALDDDRDIKKHFPKLNMKTNIISCDAFVDDNFIGCNQSWLGTSKSWCIVIKELPCEIRTMLGR